MLPICMELSTETEVLCCFAHGCGYSYCSPFGKCNSCIFAVELMYADYTNDMYH